MKSKLLALLTKDLNKYNVNVSDLSYFEDNSTKNFKLNLVSSNDKKITQMIEYLTKIYGGKFHFSLEEISYKEANKKYFAELKVRIL